MLSQSSNSAAGKIPSKQHGVRPPVGHATARRELIVEIKRTIQERRITQSEAARLCQTDAPTLSKVLRGRLGSVTIDKLADWLTALGRPVEIRVGRLIAPLTDRAIITVVSSVEEGS